MLKQRMETIAAIVASSGWLLYWTGRFYRETYFGEFQISYEMLGFETWYYIYSSWVTIVVAMAFLFLLLNPVVSFWTFFFLKRRNWKIVVMAFASFVLLLWVGVAIFTPTVFSPQDSVVHKILGSEDILIMFSILPSTIIMVLNSRLLKETLISAVDEIGIFLQRLGLLRVLCFSGVFLIIFLYLGLIAHLVGGYHARKAIKEGKMGVKMVRVDDEWWLYVVRTKDGRNFLYDRKENIAKSVEDKDLVELRSFDPRL